MDSSVAAIVDIDDVLLQFVPLLIYVNSVVLLIIDAIESVAHVPLAALPLIFGINIDLGCSVRLPATKKVMECKYVDELDVN